MVKFEEGKSGDKPGTGIGLIWTIFFKLMSEHFYGVFHIHSKIFFLKKLFLIKIDSNFNTYYLRRNSQRIMNISTLLKVTIQKHIEI